VSAVGSGGASARDRDPSCIFCRIVADELPSTRVAEDELAIAFRDIAPQAPTHILVVPRVHIPSAAHLTDADSPLSGHLLAMAAEIARNEGISSGGYRITTAVGTWAGQTVDHLHFHVMGGRPSRSTAA
jgi:histidine triad (HIT) family protein